MHRAGEMSQVFETRLEIAHGKRYDATPPALAIKPYEVDTLSCSRQSPDATEAEQRDLVRAASRKSDCN